LHRFSNEVTAAAAAKQDKQTENSYEYCFHYGKGWLMKYAAAK